MEFTRNFGQDREIAQSEPVAVTIHGRATGYFVSAARSRRCNASRPRVRPMLSGLFGVAPVEVKSLHGVLDGFRQT